jgi:hypothetical protein
MRFKELYMIKESGICFFSWKDSDPGHGNHEKDLVTSLLSAIDVFAKENLEGRQIRCIELDDGMKVYMKNVKVNVNTIVKVVIVFPEGFHDFTSIDKNVLAMKWDLEKYVKSIDSPSGIDEKMEKELREKISMAFEKPSPGDREGPRLTPMLSR